MRRDLGTVEQRNGRFRARARVDGKLISIGTFASNDEAESAIVLFSEQHQADAPFCGMSLRAWGRKWLDERELDGVHRSSANDRSVWRSRIDTAAFAELPLNTITPKDIRDWVALQIRTPVKRGKGPAKPPAKQTVTNALNLLRVALEAACEAELLAKNPARDIRVPRIARNTDPWTWLSAHEITQLTGERVEQPYRDIFTFAIYTGLRAGEVFGLEWSDVDLDAAKLKIRHSWRGTPTKRGETRELHLFGPAAAALRRQLERSKKYKHVFPAADGEPHARGYDAQLGHWLEKAAIKRRVRFHDLRHTCASHLVSGTWGRAWTIEEVAAHLGHATSVTSRRYAHLSPEGLARAAKETRPELAQVVKLPTRPERDPKEVPMSSQTALLAIGSQDPKTTKSPANAELFLRATCQNRTGDLRFTKPGSAPLMSSGYDAMGTLGERAVAALERMREGQCTAGEVAAIAAEVIKNPPAVVRAAQRYLGAIGGEHEGMAAVELLGLVLEEARHVQLESERHVDEPNDHMAK